MTPEQFKDLIKPVTDAIAGHAVDQALEDRLNAAYPAGSEAFEAIEAACHDGIAAGWMCAEGEGDRRFGRVFEPAEDTHDLSVDVVDITDFAGPHHSHPTGEVLMVMPQDADARFCGRGRGWVVCGPGTGHRPAVKGGRAVVLYLLPQGRIEWSE